MEGRLGMGLPLTSPAIPAFVHPRRRELAVAHLAVSVFAVRFAHILRRAVFGFASLTSAAFFFIPSSLSLSSILLPVSSSLPLASFLSFPFLSSYFTPFFLAFRLRCLFAHQTMDSPGRPACLWSTSVFLRIASRSSLRLPTL